MIKFISKNIKPLVPKFIYENIRKIFTALLTPIFFSKDTWHFRSSMNSLAVDNNSKPICWFSYPAIDYLETLDFKNIDIEFMIVKRKLYESEDFVIKRVQLYKPASGKVKLNKVSKSGKIFEK